MPSPEDRTASLQNLIQQIAQKSIELGYLALRLHRQGELAHDALTPLCQELWQLEQKLSTQQTPTPEPPMSTMAESSAVAPSPDQDISAAPGPEPSSISASDPGECPNCSAAIRPGKKFCSACGTSFVEVAPATAEAALMPTPAPPELAPPSAPIETVAPQPGPAAVQDICPSCQNPLQPDARFCTFCGEPIGDDSTFTSAVAPPPSVISPVVPSAADGPITQFCDNCGRGMPANATTCPDCGGTEFSG